MSRCTKALRTLLMLLMAAPLLAQEAPPPPPGRPDPPEHPAQEAQKRAAEARERALEQHQRTIEEHQRRIEDLRRELERNRDEMNRDVARIPHRLPMGEVVAPGGAWLGVQLCPVPAAVAAHLQLEKAGVMVCNIFKDSPADRAGLDRYDVIVEVDGKPAPGGMEAVQRFSEHVRGKKPGQALELIVVHRGDRRPLRIELGEGPREPFAMKPKFEDDPDVAHLREFGLRGKIARPGEGGRWIIEDLGELPTSRFGDMLWRFGPRREGGREGAGARVEEGRRVDKDGNVLHVERGEDGQITVRRYHTGEDKEKGKVTRHKSLEGLRQEDPDAAKMLESAPPAPRPPGPIPHIEMFTEPAPPPAPGQPEDPARAERWREWNQRFFQGPMRELRERPDVVTAVESPPKTRFDVRPNGEITVQTRDGDAEMSMTFKSRDELREKAPKLFQRFEEMEARMRGGDNR